MHNARSTKQTSKGITETAIRSTKEQLIMCRLEDRDFQTALTGLREMISDNETEVIEQRQDRTNCHMPSETTQAKFL